MSKEAIARQRIQKLFEQAKAEFPNHPNRAHRYVQIARKISHKARISIFKPYSYQYCKNCLHYQFPGKNQRKRTYKGKIILTCLDCKTIRRIPMR